MKSIFGKELILAGVLLLVGAGTARADMDTMLRTKVPFPFVVNGHTLPAGKYIIQRDELSRSILLIRGNEKNNAGGVFLATVPDGGHDPAGAFKPILTFRKVENQYRLTGVWNGDDEGFDVIGR